jgi:hypothetical protein
MTHKTPFKFDIISTTTNIYIRDVFWKMVNEMSGVSLGHRWLQLKNHLEYEYNAHIEIEHDSSWSCIYFDTEEDLVLFILQCC